MLWALLWDTVGKDASAAVRHGACRRPALVMMLGASRSRSARSRAGAAS